MVIEEDFEIGNVYHESTEKYGHDVSFIEHHNHNNNNHDCYNDNVIRSVQAVYIIASLLWVVLIATLGLWKQDWLALLLLLLPIVVYTINFVSLGDFTCSSEEQMFRGNLLSFGFLVAIILINWNSPIGKQNKTEFFRILIAAFILLMISLIDLWVSPDNMSIAKHVETALHTASLSLLALGLYLYYTYHRDQTGGVLF